MSRCPYCGLKYCERIDHKNERIAELEAAKELQFEIMALKEQTIDDLQARLDAIAAALRDVCHYAKPRYVSSREKAVRDGFILSGALKHYEIMPHIIHQAQQALGGDDETT